MGGKKSLRLIADVQRATAHLRDEGARTVCAISLSFGAPYAAIAVTQIEVDAAVLSNGPAALEPCDRVEAPMLGHFADDSP